MKGLVLHTENLESENKLLTDNAIKNIPLDEALELLVIDASRPYILVIKGADQPLVRAEITGALVSPSILMD
jgi:hypothetical protein